MIRDKIPMTITCPTGLEQTGHTVNLSHAKIT